MIGKFKKNTAMRSSYTDSLMYLSREAERDGLHFIATEIDKTRKKIELLNSDNANGCSNGTE